MHLAQGTGPPPSTCNPLTSVNPTFPFNPRPVGDEWLVQLIRQPPPPPRARRPDYEHRIVEGWRHAIPYVMNYGHLSEEKHEIKMEAGRIAHERANAQWERRMPAAGFPPTHRVPASDPVNVIQTENQPLALPQVHGAPRANDPQAPTSQPLIAKKAPPSSGKPIPAGVIRGEIPPMIGTGVPVQPPPPAGLPSTTPTTPANPPPANPPPANPPRPPPAALPQPVDSAPAATKPKHPLPQPAQEGPQPKQIRTKAFPKGLGDASVVTTPQQAPPAQEQRPPSPSAAAVQRQQVVRPDQQAAFDEALRMAKRNKINIVVHDPNQQLI